MGFGAAVSRCIGLLLLCFAWGQAACAQPLQVAYLPDGPFALEAIAQTPTSRWLSAPAEGIYLGFTPQAYWVRVVVPPLSTAHYLSVSYPHLDHLRVYHQQEQQGQQWVELAHTGDQQPFAQRPILHRNFLAPIAASSSEQTLYLWVQTEGVLQLPLQLLTPAAQAHQDEWILFGHGSLAGFFLAIALFAAFLWATHRQWVYALFGLLMLSYMAVAIVFSGLAFAYLWPQFPAINNFALLACLSFATALAARFACSLFALHSSPAYYLYQLMAVCALGIIAARVFLPFGVCLQASMALIGAFTLLQMALSLSWLRQDKPCAAVYFAAWLLFAGGFLGVGLAGWGVLDDLTRAFWFSLVACVGQALLLTFLVCNKVKHTSTARLAAQFAATAQQPQIRAQEQVQAMQLALAVQEKTAALQAALAEVNKLNMELSKQTITDSLTGLFNRRHFDHLLDTEVRRAAREQRSISLVLIDVDHFKNINDTYGHPVGDDCLIQLARLLRHIVRQPPDILFRYGGEEMALLLPGSDSAGARIVAEKICSLVAASEFCYPAGCLQLTLSLGVGSWVPGANMQPRELFELADKALYMAKNRGRNRVASLTLGDKEPVEWG